MYTIENDAKGIFPGGIIFFWRIIFSIHGHGKWFLKIVFHFYSMS